MKTRITKRGRKLAALLQRRLAQGEGPGRGISAAYLFGSSLGNCKTACSDIDLAVLIHDGKKGLSLDRICDIESRLHYLLKIDDIDVLVLNNAPLQLQFRVVSEGVIVYESNDTALADFVEQVLSTYQDFDYYLEEYYREFIETLKQEAGVV